MRILAQSTGILVFALSVEMLSYVLHGWLRTEVFLLFMVLWILCVYRKKMRLAKSIWTLCKKVSGQIGVQLNFEGRYKWVVFLPSRLHHR